jgi:hypothetical protein
MSEDNKQDTTVAKGAGKDELALELMKFIAVSTGYGKSPSGAGFVRTTPAAEDQVEALFKLFERCRKAVNSPLS